MLLYVFPLKFLFSFVAVGSQRGVFTGPYQLRELMIVYGAGFTAIQLCFAALYSNAWRQRVHLELNDLETAFTKSSFWNCIGKASIGLICCLAARLLPPDQAGRAGYAFMLLLVWGRLHALVARRYHPAPRSRTKPQDQAPFVDAS